MKKTIKHYDKDFKLECVEFFLNSNKSMRQVSIEFGICYQTFCSWVSEYKKNGRHSFKGKGVVKDCNAELFALKKELADVKMERDILKKAAAIFLTPKK